MDPVQWVVARRDCSPNAMFEKLRLEVEEDVKIRNGLRPKECHYGFRFATSGSSFSAIREGNKLGKSIAFHLNDSVIAVKDDKGQTLFTATLTLDDEGKCKFKIGKDERESWQVRKRALEELFFLFPEVPDFFAQYGGAQS